MVIEVVSLSIAVAAWASALFVVRRERKLHRKYIADQAMESVCLRQERRALLEGVMEGVVVVDGQMEIQSINRQARTILKEGAEMWQGQRFPERAKGYHALIKCLKSGERVKSSIDGEENHLSLNAVPLEGGRGALLLIGDLSIEQKMLDMGKEFIANASHEMRTPVTIIKGFAETLRDVEEVSDVMFESILDKIIRNCQRMEHLVKHLLRLTDLENTTLSNAIECDLSALVENVSHSLLNVYPEVRIEQLATDDEPLVWGDPGLLELLLSNLFKNAVKYSEAPATIVVRIQCEREMVHLQVMDRGMGIPKEDLPKIFERFYTVDKARCRQLGGAGLGLSIVKLIVEKHEGKIWVHSQLGEGTTFHIDLPTPLRARRQMKSPVALSR